VRLAGRINKLEQASAGLLCPECGAAPRWIVSIEERERIRARIAAGEPHCRACAEHLFTLALGLPQELLDGFNEMSAIT